MASQGAIRPTCAEVDLAALVANATLLRQLGPLFAVVKADAYGHGAVRCARALADSGQVAGLAVSLVEEGAEIRQAGVTLPILVMGPSVGASHREMVELALTPFVSDPGDLERFAAVGRSRGRPVGVHLKVDTGMGRLGILPPDLPRQVALCTSDSGVELLGVGTHFACADTDDPGDPQCMTAAQLRCFSDLAMRVRAEVGGDLLFHAANSAALLRFPGLVMSFARPGLALYGGGARPPLGQLAPVMRFRSRIAHVRDVPAGTSVSYGALWTARRPSRLAILPVGYADGFPRSLTGKAEVLVGGRRCPVVGAISMDITVVDVTGLGDSVSVGDPVDLLGKDGDEVIPVSEFAERAELTEYEVTCGISKRVPRVYS